MKLAVKVTPGASRSEIIGWEEDPHAGRVLKLRIAAPPVEGKANKEVAAFLAKKLGVPKSAVTLLHGDSSRVKLLQIPDAAAETLRGW